MLSIYSNGITEFIDGDSEILQYAEQVDYTKTGKLDTLGDLQDSEWEFMYKTDKYDPIESLRKAGITPDSVTHRGLITLHDKFHYSGYNAKDFTKHGTVTYSKEPTMQGDPSVLKDLIAIMYAEARRLYLEQHNGK